MEAAVYLIERLAIFYMIATKSNFYYVVSTIVAMLTTAARMALQPEYSEENTWKLIEKLGWVFWLERIGIFLFQFYAVSGSTCCACLAWVILLFTNTFAIIESRIMLVTYFDSIDGKVAKLPKLEQENQSPMQDREGRREVETASSEQELVLALSNSKADDYDSSDSSGWEVLHPEEFEDTMEPESPKLSDNQNPVEPDNFNAEEVLSALDPIYPKPIKSNQVDTMPPLEHIKDSCSSYNPLDKNTPIEERCANELNHGEEENEKKKKRKSIQQSDEGRHDCQEEWNRLVAELDTLKVSEAELEQNTIALEEKLRFLRTYFQDSMNYFMPYNLQDLPRFSCLNVLHLEYHLRELQDEVVLLNKELEYERRCSDYYKQQCDEYSSDKKYMNRAYEDLKEMYDEERKLKVRLVK